MKKINLFVKGMVCTNCVNKIENKISKLNGVKKVKVNLSQASILIIYDDSKISLKHIINNIEILNYKVSYKEEKSIITILSLIILLFGLYYIIDNTIGFNFIPEISNGMSYGLIFIVGTLTSIHCIAMCGGIALSQSLNTNFPKGEFTSSFLYNIGRVISYTAIGGIVGGLGSILSPSGKFKGIVAIFAGIFMILLGLKMLNIIKLPTWFKFKIPSLRVSNSKRYSHITPLFIGLLNGFMPCGPLQTMQLYALGTGSILKGALSMFYFSLGTIPLMLGFGVITSIIKGNFGRKMLQLSGILVMILGIIMMNRGLSLSGHSLDINVLEINKSQSQEASIIDGKQVINMTINSDSYVFDKSIIKAGIPVKINLITQGINRCNNPILIPNYNVEVNLLKGDKTIEFTPTEKGSLKVTCWMGMITNNLEIQ